MSIFFLNHKTFFTSGEKKYKSMIPSYQFGVVIVFYFISISICMRKCCTFIKNNCISQNQNVHNFQKISEIDYSNL